MHQNKASFAVFFIAHTKTTVVFLISDFKSSSLLDRLNQSPTSKEKNQLYLHSDRHHPSISAHFPSSNTHSNLHRRKAATTQDGYMNFFKLINAPTLHAHAMQTACEEIAHHWHCIIEALTRFTNSANLM